MNFSLKVPCNNFPTDFQILSTIIFKPGVCSRTLNRKSYHHHFSLPFSTTTFNPPNTFGQLVSLPVNDFYFPHTSNSTRLNSVSWANTDMKVYDIEGKVIIDENNLCPKSQQKIVFQLFLRFSCFLEQLPQLLHPLYYRHTHRKRQQPLTQFSQFLVPTSCLPLLSGCLLPDEILIPSNSPQKLDENFFLVLSITFFLFLLFTLTPINHHYTFSCFLRPLPITASFPFEKVNALDVAAARKTQTTSESAVYQETEGKSFSCVP